MTTATRSSLLTALVLVVVFCAPAYGQQSYDGQTDIAKLLADAGRQFDTAKEDAIVLSEGQSVTWLPDGRLSTLVHRIIWINSGLAIDEYGDLRIPFDQEHCRFIPLAVRVWRDGQWWPTDSSGIVETLPFALEHAYDYTGIREMMLLFNGMEIPCIAEVAYRIEDKTPFRKGADGLWLSSSDDPGMVSWFELAVPPGMEPHVAVSAAVGAPESRDDPTTGLVITRWQVGPHAALPRPHTADPAADVPHITWSTWGSWPDLGTFVTARFQPDTLLERSLSTAADSIVRKGRTDGERARLMARFITDHVSFIDYPESYWLVTPRIASRIYGTAYGHRLDRAVLAATLFGRIGLTVRPMFVSEGLAPIESDIPSLARVGNLFLHIEGSDLSVLYRPGSSDIVEFAPATAGRTLWYPGLDSLPRVNPGGRGTLDVQVALSYEKNQFKGTGLLAADNGLCPSGQMAGLNAELKSYLSSLLTDLIKGASVTTFGPERLDLSRAVVGFAVEAPKQPSEDTTQIALTMGKLKGGILDNLPKDVQLFQKDRLSTIRLPNIMSQRLELRLDLAANQVVYSPVAETIENAAGRFSVSSTVIDSQLVVIRELSLAKTSYQPNEWPLLRQLLLAEGHEKNGTIRLKPSTKAESH